jgi:hypothetical protein
MPFRRIRSVCWLQWNAAIVCNIMLPLAAFPVHHYPAPAQFNLALSFEAVDC